MIGLGRSHFGACWFFSLGLHLAAAHVLLGNARSGELKLNHPLKVQLQAASVDTLEESKSAPLVKKSSEQKEKNKSEKRPTPTARRKVEKKAIPRKKKPSPRSNSVQTAAVSAASSTGALRNQRLRKFARTSYEHTLLSLLGKNKRYPQAARRLGIEGEVFVMLRIERTGKLLEHRITRSSGSRILDQEVRAMIARTIPFTPFPFGHLGNIEEFVVPVRFKLR